MSNPYDAPRSPPAEAALPPGVPRRWVASVLRATIAGWMGMLSGLLVWHLSPVLTGKQEPWDAAWPFYLTWMMGTGFAGGVIAGRHAWAAVVGIYAGQVIYACWALEARGAVIILVLVAVAFFGVLPTAVAAMAGGGLHELVRMLAARRASAEATIESE